MNKVFFNKDLLRKIKGFLYYTNAEIKKFKSYHYFFFQHKLNKEIKWLGFVLKNDINFWDCYEDGNRIIHLNLLF